MSAEDMLQAVDDGAAPKDARTIPAVLRRAASRWPERIALISDTERITYREYLERAETLSRAMLASGLKPGERVGIWAPNSIEFAIAAFATYLAGGAVVPLNTRYRRAEAEDILGRAGAVGLFAFSDFLGRDYLAELADTDVAANLEFAVSLRGQPTRTGVTLEEFTRRAGGVSHAEQIARERTLGPDSLSDVLFTSGTTGLPKGAMLLHGPSVRGFTEYARSLGLTDRDTLLGIPPFFHTFGLKGVVLTAAIRGASVVPVAVLDIHQAARLIEQEQVTILQGSPTIFLDLINKPGIDHTRLRSLRVAAVGAALLAESAFERIREELGIHQFANGYALTESHAICTRVYPWDDFETAATTCGRPAPGIEVRIVDELGRCVAPGVHGEVLIRGYNVMRGYLDDPKATARAIDTEGWLHTEDIGFLDDQGRLTISDRMKDMFLVGGFNAYPAEIEALMGRHAAIAECAVIGVPDGRMGEVAKAFVVLRAGTSATPEELITFARSTMANFKAPREVEIVDALPRNASGKVQKFRLRSAAGIEKEN